jgi:hypothetical protein
VKPNKIVRLKNFARVSLFFQERLHKFPTTGRATWMRHTGSGIPTFWTCFHPVDMDMQTLLHEFERRHCYWQNKRNQKRQYQNTTNIAWIIHADCACYHCVLKKLSSEFHAPTHDFNQPIYCTIFGREKNQGQIANTNSHNFNCLSCFYMWSVCQNEKYSFAFHKQLLNFDLQIFFTISWGGKKNQEHNTKAKLT